MSAQPCHYSIPARSGLLHRVMLAGYEACVHAHLARGYLVTSQRKSANADAIARMVDVHEDACALMSPGPLPERWQAGDVALAAAAEAGVVRRYLGEEFASALHHALVELHRLACLARDGHAMESGDGRRAIYVKLLDGLVRLKPAMVQLVLTPAGGA